jgi:hypothetical protein
MEGKVMVEKKTTKKKVAKKTVAQKACAECEEKAKYIKDLEREVLDQSLTIEQLQEQVKVYKGQMERYRAKNKAKAKLLKKYK